ncbi:anthranilate synthase component I family protein [Nitratifractor salsuginis]|uniref:Anthranilate synthase component 1 n=1 Tax=Nitratifractor salsuginis (strain DSM 16511 / JCM 12458 / E9I37-1) TaxID=749222 RepID=E6X0X5_NITSE|nr:anthranilate synthase component I family protein [Nitratifractor salsuginis]ADV46907.1 anthranilate synthase, component I [Nitratifractor salsuginis DSM 16511]
MLRSYLFDQLTPVALYGEIKKLYPEEVTMLFESVVTSEEGNFSFIVIGAKERLVYRDNETLYTDNTGTTRQLEEDPFAFLQEYYRRLDKERYRAIARDAGFSFVDGFIGFIGYDMVKVFEPVLREWMDDLEDPLQTPDLDLIRPKLIIGFSHKSSELTLIDPGGENPKMLESVAALLPKAHHPLPFQPARLEGEGSFSITPERYMEIVEEAKEHIRAGDVFQMLPSNRYTQRGHVDPLSFYRVLRAKNPSPYLFLLDYEDFSICGSSPEVMVRLTQGEILLRPIAGTRKRGATPQRDHELEQEMLSDPKECAEHLMLVDLGRNDVGRVAKTGTVEVPEMMRVEKYSHVMHMVSDVVAQIDEGKDMFDLFRATFTAGTMTGAPKIKAMELIARFEGLKRGFYSGSVGYFSFTGDMDSAIAIRTALIQPDKIILQAGAGVVADSRPELEELEVRNKLMALLATLKEMERFSPDQPLLILKEIPEADEKE